MNVNRLFKNVKPSAAIIAFFAAIFLAVGGVAFADTSSSATADAATPQLASNTQDQSTELSDEKMNTYQLLLKDAMDKVFAVIESIQNDNSLSEDEKLQKVTEFLRVVRYGPEKKDYFSLIDRQGKVLMDPYQPDMEGKDMASFEDLNGKKTFQDIMRVINEKGEGYVQCSWPKYEGKMPVPKILFVRAFDPIVITGRYLDNIEGYELPNTNLYIRAADGFTTFDVSNVQRGSQP